jgi:hypothetical protein
MKYSASLDEYLAGPALLEKRLAAFSAAELGYRPSWKDAWTVKEHVIHLVDSEANGFIRIKSILAQPNSECYVMDEGRWTENLRRKSEDMGKYLKLFGLIRSIVFDLLKDEPEENWNKGHYTRNYLGKKDDFTLEQALGLYCRHLAFHFEYLDKIAGELGKGA